MPILDKVFWKNPLLMWLSRLGLWNNTFPAVPFAKRAMNQRTQKSERLDAPPAPQDLLSKFLQAKKEHPDFVTDKDVLAMALSMVFAGSETTYVFLSVALSQTPSHILNRKPILTEVTYSGIALSSIFYFLLKNPRCLFKLRAEIDTLSKSSLPLSPRFPYNALQSLPYLSACIKESFRLHPPAAFSLERITPPTGARICGRDLPGGVIVACNAWTLHRDKAVFGEDVDVFRPDRWLENDGVPLAKAKEMGRTLFHFGAGAHTCLGKNIALLEITKLVSSLFTVYDVSIFISVSDGAIPVLLSGICR
jgi:cytochrome P450